MTTLMIDEELGRQAGQAAAAQGKTLDEFVHDVLSQAISGPTIIRKQRNGLPVIEVNPPTPIDPQVISRSLAEESF